MGSAVVRARRRTVRPEPCLPGDGFDYVDCFEAPAAADDLRPAVELARAGLEGAPAPLRAVIFLAHRGVLRFRLRPRHDEATVLGWQVVSSTHDVAVLEAQGPLMRGVLVARRDPESTLRLSTYLYYRRPRIARVLWTVVGPVHRRVAPYLLARAAAG